MPKTNKLECFSLQILYSPVHCLQVRPFWQTPALCANTRLGCKDLLVINTVTYFLEEFVCIPFFTTQSIVCRSGPVSPIWQTLALRANTSLGYKYSLVTNTVAYFPEAFVCFPFFTAQIHSLQIRPYWQALSLCANISLGCKDSLLINTVAYFPKAFVCIPVFTTQSIVCR